MHPPTTDRRQVLCRIAAAFMVLCLRYDAGAGEHNGMVLIPAQRTVVGASEQERKELAERFDCHPTWLGADLPQQEINVSTTCLPAADGISE